MQKVFKIVLMFAVATLAMLSLMSFVHEDGTDAISEAVSGKPIRGCFEFAALGLSDSEPVLFSRVSLTVKTPTPHSPLEKSPRPEPEPTPSREPSSLLEWPRREGGKQAKRSKISSVAKLKQPLNIGGVEFAIVAARIRADMASGEIKLSGIVVRPATATDTAHFSLDATIDSILLRGVSYNTGGKKVPTSEPIEKSSWSLSADEIVVSGLTAQISGFKQGEPYSYSVDGLSFSASGFYIDDKSAAEAIFKGGGSGDTLDMVLAPETATGSLEIGGKILFYDSLTLAVGRLSALTGRGANMLEVDGLKADLQARELSLASFGVVPQYAMEEYTPRAWNHGDWTKLEFDRIHVANLDYGTLISGKGIEADSVAIGGGSIMSYKDRNVAPTREIKYYYEMLQNIGMPVDIAVVSLTGIDAEYMELSPGDATPGVITVSDIAGRIDGLANRSRPDRDSFAVVADGMLMDSAPLHIEVEMPVGPESDRWSFSGRLGEMSLGQLNVATRHLAGVLIKSGRLHSLVFDINVASGQSLTEAVIEYEDLHVALLRKKDRDRELRMASCLADGLLIRNANPDRRGELRTGEGAQHRDTTKSQLNFVLKSLISGLKRVII